MAISQTKQAQLTTPEAVYDQPLAPHLDGANSGKNGLSTGAITGLAVGGVVACALSFVVGMQVGGSQNGGMNGRTGGPPGMSRSQNGQLGGLGGQTGGAPAFRVINWSIILTCRLQKRCAATPLSQTLMNLAKRKYASGGKIKMFWAYRASGELANSWLKRRLLI